MENIASYQAKGALQVERTHDLPAQDGVRKAWSVLLYSSDHQIRDFFAMVVPAASIWQLRGYVLTEQAGDVLSWRCK